MADETAISSGDSLRDLPAFFAPPLIGDSLGFLDDPAGFLATRARELGPVFRMHVFGDQVACFVGPEAFELFLDEKYVTRSKASPPHVQELLDPEAVPFLEGDAFKRRKALLMQVFQERALDGYARILERVMTRYARKWAELGVLTWVPELTSMSMTIAGALFIGADPDKDDPALEQAFQTAFGGMLSLPVNLPFTKYGKALRARDFLRERIAEAVTAHEGTGAGATGDDAMTRLLTARIPSGEKLSTDEVRIETFHFFGAYLAVIGGLSFLATLLGETPDVKDRLRAEVDAKLGSGPITPARLRELPYLDAVTKESRRARPVLPITFFGTVKEECSFRGVRIPKGIKAVGCIGSTLQDPRVFPEPAKFDPERWIGARAGERQAAAWVPHGGGTHLAAHRCAGEQLADLMLKAFAVLMLRDYDWELPAQDLSPTTGQLFATPRSGLDVRFRRQGVLERKPHAPNRHA